MTLQKVIESFDSHRANTSPLDEKIQWISELDKKIFSQLLRDRVGGVFNSYNAQTPLQTETLAPEEYSEIYIYYLSMKWDFKNGEIGRYNNSVAAYNRCFSQMANFINRENAVSKKTKIKAGDLYV